MKNIYWHNAGKYQADYARLCDELIPGMGAADTVAGEMLRSATRLAHDLYNNGMGNNTSGAVNFLKAKGAIDSKTHATIYDYTRGQLYDGRYKGDSLQVAVEHAIDSVMELILANPVLTTQPNTEDMFDYEDPEQHFCEECGDEVDNRSIYGSVCSYCESQWEDEEDEEDSEYTYY